MYLCINHASSLYGTYIYNLGSRMQYEDSHGSSQASSSFPCSATLHGPTSQYYTTAGNVDNSLKLDQVLLHIYYYHKQDMIQLLRSAILECLEGQHQLADRIQGGTGATDTGLHRLVYVSYFGFYMA